MSYAEKSTRIFPQRAIHKTVGQHIKQKLKKTENFIIDLKKDNFLSDYSLFYKRKNGKTLKQLLIKLTLTIIFFLLIKTLTDWIIIEAISLGLIVLALNFVLFKIYDILALKKYLKKTINQAQYGKMNLILESTFIELSQYGRKRVIFLSQLKKCVIISDIIFFIEKKGKYLPLKINKSEMKDGSFKKLTEKLIAFGVKFEE